MMLNDEENKAIVELNHFSNMTAYWKQEEYTNSEIDNYINIVLNLIEKQSKEIEILNKNMNLLREQNISYKQSIHGLKEMNKIINKKWEDKIKAKIDYLLKHYDSENFY